MIPSLGLEGAALAVLVAVAVGALIRRFLLARHFGIAIPIGYVAGPVVATAVAVAVLLLALPLVALPPIAVAGIGLVLGFAAYAGVLLAWQRVTGEPLGLAKLQAD
jgi:hypothetical protein